MKLMDMDYEFNRLENGRAYYRPVEGGSATEIGLLAYMTRANGNSYRRVIRVRIDAELPDTVQAVEVAVENKAIIKSRYPVGCAVLYEVNGQQYVGRVLRHNRKTISISNEGPVVSDDGERLEWDTTQGSPGWRISWRLAASAIIETVNAH